MIGTSVHTCPDSDSEGFAVKTNGIYLPDVGNIIATTIFRL